MEENRFFQIVVNAIDDELVEEVHGISDEVIKEFIQLIPKEIFMQENALYQNTLFTDPDEPQQRDIKEIFIPTQCFQFLKNLHSKFPRHRLLLADFNFLPESIDGILGPAVIIFLKTL